MEWQTFEINTEYSTEPVEILKREHYTLLGAQLLEYLTQGVPAVVTFIEKDCEGPGIPGMSRIRTNQVAVSKDWYREYRQIKLRLETAEINLQTQKDFIEQQTKMIAKLQEDNKALAQGLLNKYAEQATP